MKWVRDKMGRFSQRPHYLPEELDTECERVILAFLAKKYGKAEFPVKKLGVRRRKRRRRAGAQARVLPTAPTKRNETWTMDFLQDALASGRKVRTLSIEDAYTRELLAVEVDTSLPALRVVRVLEQLRQQRGLPERIVIDNGTEFTSKALDQWAYANHVTLHFITPGRPMENGYIESFHGKFREECLNQHWFLTLDDARETIQSWRIDYNWVSYCPTSLCSCEQALVLFGMKYRGSALPRPYPLFQCLCCFYFQSIPADHPGTICKRMIGRDLATVDCQP
jgi:putative transposase